MAKTSIHFEPCNVVKSEMHNSRVQELDYIFPELSKNNESLYYISNLHQREKECQQIYESKVKQKMQSKTVPIREGVVVIDEKTTMADLEILANEIKHLLGWTPLQIHIHRDEGYMKSPDNKGGSEVAKLNLHAHLIFDCQDKNTGKMHRNTKQQMSQVQDLCANILKMERGQTSTRKHLKSLEYKIQAREKQLQEQEAKIIEYKAILETHRDLEKQNQNLFIDNGILQQKKTDLQKEYERLLADGTESEKKFKEEKEKFSAQLTKYKNYMMEQVKLELEAYRNTTFDNNVIQDRAKLINDFIYKMTNLLPPDKKNVSSIISDIQDWSKNVLQEKKSLVEFAEFLKKKDNHKQIAPPKKNTNTPKKGLRR